MALKMVAVYNHGTNKFWVYEHHSNVGIFKFWIPHSKRIEGTDRYQSQQPPTTMDIHVEFERDLDNRSKPTTTNNEGDNQQ